MKNTNKLVFVDNNRVVTDSLTVAESFGKRHDRVLQDIRELECSSEFSLHHFVESDYKNERGRKYKRYLITEQGFAFLVMGYTGSEAARFKEMYINEFERMRTQLTLTPAVPTNPLAIARQHMLATEAMIVAMEETNARLTEVEDKLSVVANETSTQINDLRKGLVDIDAPLRTDLIELINEYAKTTGKGQRDVWHFLYDNLNSRNKCNIQRRHENRVKKDPNYKGSKLDIIEELRLLPDAIRFMKAVTENLKLLAKQVQPQLNNNEPF